MKALFSIASKQIAFERHGHNFPNTMPLEAEDDIGSLEPELTLPHLRNESRSVLQYKDNGSGSTLLLDIVTIQVKGSRAVLVLELEA